ncbi:putative exported protein [Buttiauxella agrestis ATCC 33320]|uniref:Putative exported protein n=1 Tax=Buttiauxella agrestis ATCC 33320 TaxID=1006004 RepID=A0A085GDU2_9ENTR|nr:putative exported protein [Buttiauxella agrestis ATCC 33320]
MKLTQIRNATLELEHAGKKFLIDPMLAEKEIWEGKDAALLRSQSFLNIRVMKDENHFVDGTTIYKTDGQHGSNELYADAKWGELLGDAYGLVFIYLNEKTLYLAGDTVWVKPYARSLQRFKPEIMVLNTGYAVNDLYGPIIMGAVYQ